MTASNPKPIEPKEDTAKQTSPASSGNKKQKTVILIMTVLIVLLLVVGSIMAWLLLRDKSDDEQDDEDKETQEETTDDDDEEDEEETEQTDDTQQEGDTTEDTEEEEDMTEGWSEYYNSTWSFGLKYPVDLAYTEIVTDPATNEMDILFKSGGSIDVFAVWVRTSGTLDNVLANMTANVCTDNSQYSNVSFSGVNYRKIKDIPDQDCLDFYGTTRDIDLVAFGRQISSGGYILGIRNEKLNNSQLEALMKTIYNN